jgi:hypothetical protein
MPISGKGKGPATVGEHADAYFEYHQCVYVLHCQRSFPKYMLPGAVLSFLFVPH